MICRSLLLLAVVLTAQLCGCTAYVGVGDGFSVELIHRDSVKSPYHDPALTTHGRVLAAARRSTARAAALARSYVGNGAVSEVVSSTFEYLMAVNLGTPPTRMLAIVDTGSNLVWVKCKPPQLAAAPPSVVFDPSSSTTFGSVGCNSAACHALRGTSCDASSNCQYLHSYGDGSSKTSGLLSTETFTFDSVPGGCPGCRDHPAVQVPKVNFGCSTSANGTFVADGIVGLSAGNDSLITQLGADTSLGRRFSYCLVPYAVKNASSALNFGARAVVTEPGAATTALIRAYGPAYYTVVLESVRIGNATFAVPNLSNVLIDSGTTVTFLDPGLLDPMVEELNRRIGFLQVRPPEELLKMCYDVGTATRRSLFVKNVPDVTLYLAVFGQAVTLKPENTFLEVEKGIMCLAIAPVTKKHPLSILGNIAQHNMHVGYDLDKGTVTFAPSDCASSYNPPPVHG